MVRGLSFMAQEILRRFGLEGGDSARVGRLIDRNAGRDRQLVRLAGLIECETCGDRLPGPWQRVRP